MIKHKVGSFKAQAREVHTTLVSVAQASNGEGAILFTERPRLRAVLFSLQHFCACVFFKQSYQNTCTNRNAIYK